MIYFLLTEVLLIVSLIIFLIKHTSFITALFKKIETKVHSIVHAQTFEPLSKIHLSLGHSKSDFEIWWDKTWCLSKIVFFTFCTLAILSQNLFWLLIPVLFAGCTTCSLIKKTRLRREKILRRIPFVLDMVILNLKSGLDFVASLEELVEINDQHPLLDEIRHTLQSIHLGESRAMAFKNLGARTQVPELAHLASVIEQSESMGSSLVELLTLQSEEIRHRIFKQAEGEAQKAPVRILIPMLLCIFPVVFIILFVPIGIKVLDVFK
jgi:Flp pilus assembly protein TadB